MPTQTDIDRWKADPLAFAEDLILPAGTGDARFGDIMAPFQRERFAVLANDLRALLTRAKPAVQNHWWEATKGASKDTDLAVATLWLLTFADKPLLVQIGAADREQAGELRKAALGILAANSWIGDRVKIENWKLKNTDGAEAEIISADVAGSHGSRPDLLIINELHAITEGRREFAENLADNAAKVPHGVRVVATNAGFQGTWQFQWRENARTHPERWYFNSWDQPAPWISAADIEEARRRNSSARFKRLWGGQWVPSTGDAIDATDVEGCIVTAGPMEAWAESWCFVAGLDLGTKHDHAAIVVLGVEPGSGICRLAAVRSWRPDPLTGVVDLIAVQRGVRELLEFYGVEWTGYDPTQAELLAQQLAAEGWCMEEQWFVGRHLNAMATALMGAFRSRTIQLFREPELVADLMRLTIVERSWGYKLTAASDDAGHADRAIALSIVLPVALELANAAPDDDDSRLVNVVVT